MTAVKRLHVLFIVHDGALYGSQHSLLLLINGLLDQSCPPIITVSMAKDGPLRERLLALGITVECHKRLSWFKHTRLSLWKRFTATAALLLGMPWRVYALSRKVATADVVHTNSLVSLEGALAAFWCQKPHIWHIREWLTHDNPGLYSVLPMTITRWVVKRFSHRVVCISDAVANGIGMSVVNSAEKAVLLPNAVTVSTVLPAKTAVFRAGFVGRFSKGKRVTDAIAAFARFHARYPDTELWLMGRAENPADANAVDLAIQQAKRDQPDIPIQVKGYCDDLAQIYPQLTVLLLPASNEAFGRVLAEAMAYGVPCIAANAGGIPDVLGNTGWLHPVGDIAALSDQLNQAYRLWLDDATRWQHHQAACHQRVNQQFTLTLQVQRVNALYQSLTNHTFKAINPGN